MIISEYFVNSNDVLTQIMTRFDDLKHCAQDNDIVIHHVYPACSGNNGEVTAAISGITDKSVYYDISIKFTISGTKVVFISRVYDEHDRLVDSMKTQNIDNAIDFFYSFI